LKKENKKDAKKLSGLGREEKTRKENPEAELNAKGARKETQDKERDMLG
jgi:hypothetical protein